MLDELADVVVGEHVRLALEVRAGGPHAVRRALDVAIRLLAAVDVESTLLTPRTS